VQANVGVVPGEGNYRGRLGFWFESLRCLLGGLTRSEASWRISDHYPLWVEFRLSPQVARLTLTVARARPEAL
jgi:hypothetical protein